MGSSVLVRHHVATLMLLALFVGDVFTDVATGVELILNDHHEWGYAVLALVALPMAGALAAEFMRACLYGGCCCCCCCCANDVSISDWIPLVFYHLYAALMIGCSRCRPKCRQMAIYLRCIEGFMEAAPQLVLQTVILLKGVHIHSLRDLIEAVRQSPPSGFDAAAQLAPFLASRTWRWYWGLIQAYSWLFSFVSLVQTCVQFNEWEKRRHTIHRLVLAVPFFACSVLYRTMSLALLIALVGLKVVLLPVVAFTLAQVLTFRNLGLDILRSLVYGGLCSFLAPNGYTRCRDPESQPFGLSLTPYRFYPEERGRRHWGAGLRQDGGGGGLAGCDAADGGDRTPEQVEMLRSRSKNYLVVHVILGGAILGICLAILGMFLNFTTLLEPLPVLVCMELGSINDVYFPSIGILYMASIFLTGVFCCCIGRCFEEEYIYPV